MIQDARCITKVRVCGGYLHAHDRPLVVFKDIQSHALELAEKCDTHSEIARMGIYITNKDTNNDTNNIE